MGNPNRTRTVTRSLAPSIQAELALHSANFVRSLAPIHHGREWERGLKAYDFRIRPMYSFSLSGFQCEFARLPLRTRTQMKVVLRTNRFLVLYLLSLLAKGVSCTCRQRGVQIFPVCTATTSFDRRRSDSAKGKGERVRPAAPPSLSLCLVAIVRYFVGLKACITIAAITSHLFFERILGSIPFNRSW